MFQTEARTPSEWQDTLPQPALLPFPFGGSARDGLRSQGPCLHSRKQVGCLLVGDGTGQGWVSGEVGVRMGRV